MLILEEAMHVCEDMRTLYFLLNFSESIRALKIMPIEEKSKASWKCKSKPK